MSVKPSKEKLVSNDPVDVLIIGAGASGAAMAWSLAETRMKILCLEQGEWVNPADYPSTSLDWELKSFGEFSYSPNTRKRSVDYPINEKNSPIKVANFNGVGGGTILYAAHFPRFHPSDFKVKSLDGVADDWPIDYQTLEPFYAENDQMVGVAGLKGDPAYPDKEVSMSPVPLGVLGETLARGFNEKGWHWWPSDSAIATEPYDGRDKCVNLGPCTTGCSQGAKASTDITYWPHALRAGVELRTRCRVKEITVDEGGMASGVIYFDENGHEQIQKAEVVVVACNGIGTPRLLLNSTSIAFPNGIANSSGMVGKNLMFHPYGHVQGMFDQPLKGYQGPGGCCIWSQEFYETDESRGYLRGYTMEIFRGKGLVSTAISGMTAGTIPWGKGHHDAYLREFDKSAGMVIICEDLPELHNTVTLDPDLVDSDGMPAPKIDYTLSENSRRMLDHGMARGKEALIAAGAYEVSSHGPIAHAGWHNMGTARMGIDPQTSVVNEWGRSHDVKNLFIVDGSIFVTSAGVNPTSTIQALALYIADAMKKRLANLFD